MHHLDPDEILRGFDSARDDAHRERMYRHVAACRECRDLMAEAISHTAPTGTGDRETPPALEDRWPVVPYEHYEIGDEVGRGGLGKVVRARHVALDRDVAIKELLRPGPIHERRFVREAHVTASLQHPGVVPVLEAGRWPSGEPFYATKLVSGRTLHELMSEATNPAARLALLPNLIAVGETLAYAHSRGVEHRDVKPSNILVGEFGETVVIDWGLAKLGGPAAGVGRRDLGDETAVGSPPADPRLTRADEVLGTPQYMAPEQARGEPTDPRCDVYALGVILYELLAGGSPYDAAPDNSQSQTLPPLLGRIRLGLIAPLARRAPDAPRELAAIAARAMAFAPDDRYADARALVDDLKRFATGQLVSARSYSGGELLMRWIRRHWLLNTVIASAVAILVVVVAFAAMGVTRARRVAERSVAQLELDQGRSAHLAGDPQRALAYLGAALRDGGDATMTRYLLARAGESVHRRGHVLRMAAPISGAAMSPDGTLVLTGDDQGAIDTWDAATGRTVASRRTDLGMIQALDLSPRGDLVAAQGTGALVWDLATGAEVARLPSLGSGIGGLRFSDDGAMVVRWEGGVMAVWDADQRAERFSVEAHAMPIVEAVVTRDGTAIVTFAWNDPVARVWDATSGRLRCELHTPGGGVAEVTSAAGGDVVVTSDHGWAALEETTTCTEVRRFATRVGEVFSLRVDDPGRRVLLAGSRGLELWDAATATLTASADLRGLVHAAIFTPDGERIVASDDTGLVHVLSARDGQRQATLAGHATFVRAFGWSRDGGLLLSMALDGEVRLWRDVAGSAIATSKHVWKQIGELPDGSVVAIDQAGDGWRRDRQTGTWVAGAPGVCPRAGTRAQLGVRCMLESGLALRTTDGRAGLVRLDGGPTPPPSPDVRATAVALAPGGRLAAVASATTEIVVWEVASGRVVATLAIPGADLAATSFVDPRRVRALSFLDDRRLVSRSGTALVVWDLGRRVALRQIPSEAARQATLLATHGRSGLILALGGERDAELRDADTGRVVAALQGLPSQIIDAEFSPDGRLVVTRGREASLSVWDTRTGTLLDRIVAGDEVGFLVASDGALITADSAGELERRELTLDRRGHDVIERALAACVPYEVTGGRLAARAKVGRCESDGGAPSQR